MIPIINRLKNNKTLVNGSLFSIFSFFNQGTSFLLLIILAGYIPPASYGNLSLFNTIVQFLGYFAALSTQGYLSVSYFKRGKHNFNKDFSSIIYICIAITILLFFILLIGGKQFCLWTNISQPFLWMAVIISALQVIWSMLLDYYRILEKVGRYGLYSCSFALINFIISLYLVIVLNQGWEGRIYAQFICIIIFGIITLCIFIKDKLFTSNINWQDVKTILLWGIPLIPHLASIWIKQGGDRFIINHFHTIEDVGLFSFALNLTSIIFMVGSAFNATNSITIFQTLSANINRDEKIKKLNKQKKDTMYIYIVADLLIVISMSILIPIILPKYVSAIPYFLILSIQGLGQCFYFLFCNYLFYYHKNKQIMYVTFGASLLHLCLSLIMTRYSMYYTCIIYVIVQFLIVSIIYILSQKVLLFNLKKE